MILSIMKSIMNIMTNEYVIELIRTLGTHIQARRHGGGGGVPVGAR